jgi:anti-sigma factor RsiW
MTEQERDEERIVEELLRTRLPPRPAPDRLKRAVAAQVARAVAADTSPVEAARRPLSPAAQSGERWSQGRRTVVAGLGALSIAAAFALGLFVQGRGGESPLLREGLNNHLRVLYAQNPIEIPNGGLHQVKPWFSGRVDFAPDIAFAGDDEFPMVGGAVSYFVDRKAASFVFKRRLHTISLFVFRGEGVDWPHADSLHVGTTRVEATTLDGFHLVFWQAHGLGHVLVSDVSTDELLGLTSKLL